ncbi:MAG TPA: MFS transporter [Actinomycetota bacterium]|nr:MFS transporter [Actinomycetota bacterium]
MRERRRWTLLVVCLATGVLLLNVSSPSVTLPAVGRDLDAELSVLQWVVSGYSLALAATLLTAGTLADLVGRRRMFLGGLIGFAAASALCAVAPSALALVAGRAVQGLAGAVLLSSSLALLAQDYTGTDRAGALGVWGATVAAAFAVGPLEGGVLTEALGWRAIFAVDAAVALACLPVAVRRLRESRDPDAGKVDWWGTLTLSLGLFLGVFALTRGDVLGWGSWPILASAAGAALLLAAFVVVERREREPMLDLGLFAIPTFTGASLVVMVIAASTFGPFLYLTLFLLDAAGASPTAVGLELMPLSAAALVVSVLGGRYARVLPVRVALPAGQLLCAAGLLAMRGLEATSPWTVLLPGLLVMGVGIGLANPTVTYAALSVVPATRSGMASGVNNTFRQVGIALGIATLGALLPARIDDPAAFAAALDRILLVSAGVAAVGAVLAVTLVRQRDFVVDPVLAERQAA